MWEGLWFRTQFGNVKHRDYNLAFDSTELFIDYLLKGYQNSQAPGSVCHLHVLSEGMCEKESIRNLGCWILVVVSKMRCKEGDSSRMAWLLSF